MVVAEALGHWFQCEHFHQLSQRPHPDWLVVRDVAHTLPALALALRVQQLRVFLLLWVDPQATVARLRTAAMLLALSAVAVALPVAEAAHLLAAATLQALSLAAAAARAPGPAVVRLVVAAVAATLQGPALSGDSTRAATWAAE